MKLTIEDHVGARFEVQRMGPDEMRIIAREEARREAPREVARQLASPRSAVSKSLRANTTATTRVD